MCYVKETFSFLHAHFYSTLSIYSLCFILASEINSHSNSIHAPPRTTHMCTGIVLADEGNHKDAVAFLSRPLESGKLKIVGGSNEQREVLREFYVDTLMKAQQHEQARRMLTGMLEERSCVEAYRQMLHKIQSA